MAIGMAGLAAYSSSPGDRSQTPDRLPRLATALPDTPVDSLLGQLFVFLHPKCPCSMATVRQLARLTPQQQERFDIKLYFFQPRSQPSTWSRTKMRVEAAQLGFAELFDDVDGEFAMLFGAYTSGHSVAYSAAGKLLFSGGITAGRGHEGDNPGFTRLRQLLAADTLTSGPLEYPVFGCAIHRLPEAVQ